MSDEHKLNGEIERRARAEALLQNELLREAFAELEQRYVEEWRGSEPRDADARERLWQAVNVLRKVKDHLSRVVRDGRLAQRQLDELAGRRRRFGL